MKRSCSLTVLFTQALAPSRSSRGRSIGCSCPSCNPAQRSDSPDALQNPARPRRARPWPGVVRCILPSREGATHHVVRSLGRQVRCSRRTALPGRAGRNRGAACCSDIVHTQTTQAERSAALAAGSRPDAAADRSFPSSAQVLEVASARGMMFVDLVIERSTRLNERIRQGGSEPRPSYASFRLGSHPREGVIGFPVGHDLERAPATFPPRTGSNSSSRSAPGATMCCSTCVC